MNMTRQEIYDHIWTRTVQGFADEFNLNYPMLLRRIKEADIPKPSRKEILFIRQGEDGLRAVHRPELPGDPEEEVRLAERREPEQTPETTVRKSPKKTGTKKKVRKSAPKEKEPEQAVPEEIPELIDYEKHPRWTSLYFLPQAERRKVIRETENIRLKDGEPVHPTVIALQREIAAWQTQVDILGDEDFASAVLDKPSLLDRVSEENVERVFRILDSLYTSVELLGEKVLPDGSVAIHDQVVNLRFTESRARVPADPSVYDELDHAVHRQTHAVRRLPLLDPGPQKGESRRPPGRCTGTALPDGFPTVPGPREQGRPGSLRVLQPGTGTDGGTHPAGEGL